ncbi:MAG: hypothetical protein LBC03_01950 [Nitrososphaerota archaeon]|jgi:hypothetical protein|nr:hypothetical protein [Nitrososphaerota archaeon]
MFFERAAKSVKNMKKSCRLPKREHSQNYEHCGLCLDFPCDLLNQFSYDQEQGDNGKRIKQCRKWAKSN